MPDLQSNAESEHDREVAQFLTSRRHDLDEVLGALGGSVDALSRMATLMVSTLRSGRVILTAGNGGSATQAQHFSAELVGRFRRERGPLPAIALTADTAVLTALGNDYGYHDVFARQVHALAREGDLFLAFSTSGESENLIRAASAAHERSAKVVCMTGAQPNRLVDASDLALRVPSPQTAIVQEIHLLATHLLCGIVEDALTE